MASRRDSRTHIDVRQNDALLEFENFKRKYLLVNKHITKLNSTLSVRVQELNAQVANMHAQNLRLRASEISLTNQLKKEKKKSQAILEEAEVATTSFINHLSTLRTNFEVPLNYCSLQGTPESKHQPRKPVHTPREGIAMPIVRPPAQQITQIHETDEESGRGSDCSDHEGMPTFVKRQRSPPAHHLSSSRLPLPKYVQSTAQPLRPSSPVPTSPTNIPHVDLIAAAASSKRKQSRRYSGFVAADHTAFALDVSPAPPMENADKARKSTDERATEEQEVEQHMFQEATPQSGLERSMYDNGALRRLHKTEKTLADGTHTDSATSKIKERIKDIENEFHSTSERESAGSSREKDRKRFGITDVTNSPRKRSLEITKPDTRMGEDHVASRKRSPSPKPATPTPSTQVSTSPFDSLATPLPSVSSATSSPTRSESGDPNARERRARKTISYAEPKLNTKMRKPDPPPGQPAPKSRSSTGGATRRRKTAGPVFSDDDGDADVEGATQMPKLTERRRKTVSAGLNPLCDIGPGSAGAADRRQSMLV